MPTNFAENRSKPGEDSRLRIVFTRYNGGYLRTYVISADGSGQARLTNNGGVNEVFPAWSPDGTKIVFETYGHSDVSGLRHVYVIDADGSGQSDLAKTHASTEGNYATPAWSPDGTKIVFSADNGIHMINADGSDETRLTEADQKPHLTVVDRYPTWSPDCKKIAFLREASDTTQSDAISSASPTRVSERSGLYVVNADGSGLRKLPNQAAYATAIAWSPDSKKIAFSAHKYSSDRSYSIYSDIFVTTVGGSYQTRLTETPAVYEDSLGPDSLAWQPNGEKIAFVRTYPEGYYEIFETNVEGSDQTRLTKKTSQGQGLSTWSPDGRKIVLLSGEAKVGLPVWNSIYMIKADGTGRTHLNSVQDAASVDVVFVPEDRR